MLTLQIFEPSFGLKSPSPFSTKAIALLNMSQLEYKIENGDLGKAPKKKLPVLIDDGHEIADSTHIQAYLKEKYNIDFDKNLSNEQLAIAEAFRRMNEEHLYWVLVYSRWIENGDKIRDVFFAAVPAPMRQDIFNTVLKEVQSSLNGHGMGRHSAKEIYEFGTNDLKAISSYLGNKKYFFGDKPNSIDASISTMLDNIITPDIDTPLKQSVLSFKNLLAYSERCNKKFNMAI